MAKRLAVVSSESAIAPHSPWIHPISTSDQRPATGPYGSLRARYFSQRPLTADESVMSRDSLVFNARAGYRQEKWDVYVELLNVFDSKANDIEYFYESRLPGEPVGDIADTHYHPMEPFTVRTGVAVHW